jgi:hypothetical protein
MNIKKIIPLSLAAMSMMGAFTACSDNKVVGADEQTNTMAELSSSSEQSSSSLFLDSKSMASLVMAKVMEHADEMSIFSIHMAPTGEIIFEDSVNANASFENRISSIINNDQVEWKHYQLGEDAVDEESYAIALKKANKVYGPLYYGKMKGSAGFSCPQNEARPSYSLRFTDAAVIKELRQNTSFLSFLKGDTAVPIPSLSLEQFERDCEAENGRFWYEEYGIHETRGTYDDGKALWGDYTDARAFCSIYYVDPDAFECYSAKPYIGDCQVEKNFFSAYDQDLLYSDKEYLDSAVALFDVYEDSLKTLVKNFPSDSNMTYKDPYWEKYVRLMLDLCTTTLDH